MRLSQGALDKVIEIRKSKFYQQHEFINYDFEAHRLA